MNSVVVSLVGGVLWGMMSLVVRPQQGAVSVDIKPEYAGSAPMVMSPLTAWPANGPISQAFGCSPFYSGITGPGCPAATPWFHDGLDLAIPAGTPVQAGLSGTIIFAGADGSGPPCGQYRGYGLSVVVANQTGWQTLYAHLDEIRVEVGQVVTATTIIGASGATGCVSGPHLHFGLRNQSGLLDPQAYLPAR